MTRGGDPTSVLPQDPQDPQLPPARPEDRQQTKQTAYKALVRPFLEYAATVWDPYTASKIQAIEKVQRIAACKMGLQLTPPDIMH